MPSWATLIDDIEEPLAAYLATQHGLTLTPEQARALATRVEQGVRPYAQAEAAAATQAATDAARAAFEQRRDAYVAARDALVELLAALTSRHGCVLLGSYCAAHDRDEPCPHGLARAWLTAAGVPSP